MTIKKIGVAVKPEKYEGWNVMLFSDSESSFEVILRSPISIENNIQIKSNDMYEAMGHLDQLGIITNWNDQEFNYIKNLENDVIPSELHYTVEATSIGIEEDSSLYVLEDVIDVEFEEKVSKADKIDYSVAAASGLLTGMLNILWLGDFSLLKANEWGTDKINKVVMIAAKKNGYKGNDLKSAIRCLEEKFPMSGDELTAEFGGGRQHHLRDFQHHPTPVGLMFSLITQFTGKGFGTNTNGNFVVYDLPFKKNIGEDIPEKIYNATYKWVMHMISDMGGSSTALSGGTGIPGPIVSLFEEAASLPFFKNVSINSNGELMQFSKWVSKIFNGTHHLLNENGVRVRFDLRTEVGIYGQLAKSAIPVIANEIIVRFFYFMRALINEIKLQDVTNIGDLDKINIDNIIPLRTRKLDRMLTVSSGTFFAVTTVSTVVRSKTPLGVFLNLNYFGIGRFIVAINNDSKYIIEDIKEVREEYIIRQNSRYDSVSFEALDLFSLNNQQSTYLDSLKYHKTLWDIANTKDVKKKELKEKWLLEWSKGISLIKGESYLIADEDILYAHLNEDIINSSDRKWLYLITLELLMFNAYFSFDNESSLEYKGLKYTSDYIKDVFVEKQSTMDLEVCKSIVKEYNRSISILKNNMQKIAVGVGATVAITAVTGGAALVFAPKLAVLLAGGSFVGLKGAALTSASLAFLGGGSLAAGGLGMAGGTAVITGGGALLGFAGAGSVSSVLMSTSDVYTLNECAKILTFSRQALLLLDNAREDLDDLLKLMIQNTEIVKEDYSLLSAEDEVEDKKQHKNRLDNYKKSIHYLEQCIKELDGLSNSLIA